MAGHVAASITSRIAFVTGGNKGIGKQIAYKLGKAGLKVVIGSQDTQSGHAATQELRADGCDVDCTQLELCDPASVLAARDFIAKRFGRLDVLVNNAAICFNDPTLYGACAFTPFEKQAGITVSTNFFGTLDVTEAMLPLLRSAASPRIVTVASHAGRLSILRSQEKIDAFTSPSLQIQELAVLMKEFVCDVESGSHASKGWPNTCYGLSKLGLIALTKILSRDEPGIMVNCVDPGYCATDQNNNGGSRSPEHGARGAAFLALLPDDQRISGKYFMDEAEKDW
jgi:carbonyl reductase 1